MSLFEVDVIGRASKDAEMTYSEKGLAIAKFGVAVNGRDKDGKEKTDWLNVTAFGKVAENASKLVTKGVEVYVTGRAELSAYTDKSGNARASFNVVATDFRVFGAKTTVAGADSVSGDAVDELF